MHSKASSPLFQNIIGNEEKHTVAAVDRFAVAIHLGTGLLKMNHVFFIGYVLSERSVLTVEFQARNVVSGRRYAGES